MTYVLQYTLPTAVTVSLPDIKDCAFFDIINPDTPTLEIMMRDYEAQLAVNLPDLCDRFGEIIDYLIKADDPSFIGRVYQAVDVVMRDRIQSTVLDIEGGYDIDICRDTAYNVLNNTLVALMIRIIKVLMGINPHVPVPAEIDLSIDEHMALVMMIQYDDRPARLSSAVFRN